MTTSTDPIQNYQKISGENWAPVAPNGKVNRAESTDAGELYDLADDGLVFLSSLGSGMPTEFDAEGRRRAAPTTEEVVPETGELTAEETTPAEEYGRGFLAPSVPTSQSGMPIAAGMQAVSAVDGTPVGIVTRIDGPAGTIDIADDAGNIRRVRADSINISEPADGVNLGEIPEYSADDDAIIFPRDRQSGYYREPAPEGADLGVFDSLFVPSTILDAAEERYDNAPENIAAGRLFRTSPYSEILQDLARYGSTDLPDGFVLPEEMPRAAGGLPAVDLLTARGILTEEEGDEVRRAVEEARKDFFDIEEENMRMGGSGKRAEEEWKKANAMPMAPSDATIFQLKGLGPEIDVVRSFTDAQAETAGDFLFAEIPTEMQEKLPELNTWLAENADLVEKELFVAGLAGTSEEYEFPVTVSESITDIDEVINTSPAPEDIIVRARVRLNSFVTTEDEQLQTVSDLKAMVGSTVLDYGYLLATLAGFAGSQPDLENEVLMHIRVNRGDSALWLGEKNNGNDILLPRATKLYIHRVGGIGPSGLANVYAEVVPLYWEPSGIREEVAA